MIRGYAKSAAETIAVRSGAPRLARVILPHRALVLAYHNIVPEGVSVSGERSLHLPQRRLAEQLDLILETHEIVPLDRLFDADPPSRWTARVALTFDDAYRGAVTAGLEELKRRGLPATFFVAPGFVGGGTFWWDALAEGGRLAEELRRRALEGLRGEDGAIRDWARRTGLREHAPGAFAATATEAELREAANVPGITFASHTWSHPNLAALPRQAVERELVRALTWLRERLGAVAPWLSYPYGLATPAVERMAAEMGYRGAFLIDGGGWGRLPTNPYRLPRVNVPAGISRNGFTLRLARLVHR